MQTTTQTQITPPQKDSIFLDDEVEKIISNITLKRPKSAYTQYVLCEIETIKKNNQGKKLDCIEINRKCSEKWKKESEELKKNFHKKYLEDKEKYKKDLELVKHYLFHDYNSNRKNAYTSYRIFLNEKMREGFEKNFDPKIVKKDAQEQWSKMTEKEKKKYFDQKKEIDDWFTRAKNVKNVNSLSVFIQRTIYEAKENNKNPPKLQDIIAGWKALSKIEKVKYEKYAEEINEEKQQMKDIFELTHGIKPKKPIGAFRIFLQEKAKNGELKSLKDGRELWEKLTQEQKDEFLAKAHKCHIAYIYKKMIYKQQIKKIMPKKPGTAFSQFLKEKKGQKYDGKNFLVYFRKVYSTLTQEEKAKYEEKAKELYEKYKKKLEKFEDKVFDLPKKARSPFSLYVKDRMRELHEKYKEKTCAELLKMIAIEWNNLEKSAQDKYNKESEKEVKIFKKQLKEFEQNGYYTKTDGIIIEDDEDEKPKRKSIKRKSANRNKSSTKKGDSSRKSTKSTQIGESTQKPKALKIVLIK